ncbi:hypothetical protein, partial [Actinomadura sp. HBU206391]|uniref:hypothetical protein n=1 Tax=Actinomadura sp. HBU206391 TaxID=2731692 RepID=UPI001C9D0A62
MGKRLGNLIEDRDSELRLVGCFGHGKPNLTVVPHQLCVALHDEAELIDQSDYCPSIRARVPIGNGNRCLIEVPRAFRTATPLRWGSGKVKILARPKKSFSPEYREEAV